MESEEAGCEYLDFESLTETPDSLENILLLIRSESWKDHFQGLNLLRRFNKYRRFEIIGLLQEIIAEISTFVDSPRSSLAKNSLIFITECFSLYDISLIPLALQLSQLLLIKSINEKSFIRIEALKGLKNLADNYSANTEVVNIFRNNCFHKSAPISQNAFLYLNSTLRNIDPKLSLDICLGLENCKRQTILLGAKNHIKYLKANWEDFQQAVLALNEREKKMIELVLQEKSRRSSLREAIENSKLIKSSLSSELLAEENIS